MPLSQRTMDEIRNKMIPMVVEQMRAYSLDIPERQLYNLTVYELYPSGDVRSTTEFVVNSHELIEHVRKAKRMGLSITMTDTDVTVLRPLKYGSYKAVYVPITE